MMSQNWSNGKLSQGVKSRMIKLAKGKFLSYQLEQFLLDNLQILF